MKMQTELGTSLTAGQVADYLGLDVNTVRKYYRELGGIRVGTAYRFFERTLTDAILRQTEKAIRGTNQSGRKIRPEIFSDSEGGLQVGDRPSGAAKNGEKNDKYNLLN